MACIIQTNAKLKRIVKNAFFVMPIHVMINIKIANGMKKTKNLILKLCIFIIIYLLFFSTIEYHKKNTAS